MSTKKMKESESYLQYELPLLMDLRPFPRGFAGIKTPREYLIKCFELNPMTRTKSGKIQCHSGKRRSFTDLYFIVKAKFNDFTKEELAYIIMDLIVNGVKFNENQLQSSTLYINYCSTVKKIVFHTFLWSAGGIYPQGYTKPRKYFKSKLDLKLQNYPTYDQNRRNYPFDSVDHLDILNMANKYIKLNNK